MRAYMPPPLHLSVVAVLLEASCTELRAHGHLLVHACGAASSMHACADAHCGRPTAWPADSPVMMAGRKCPQVMGQHSARPQAQTGWRRDAGGPRGGRRRGGRARAPRSGLPAAAPAGRMGGAGGGRARRAAALALAAGNPTSPHVACLPQRCPAAALRRRRARAARGGRGARGPERGGRARGAQVVCAGVWHNCVLCVGCWAAAAAMPAALAPFYSTGGGAAVRRALISGPTSPICAWLRRPPKPCARAQRLAARLSAQETVWCLEERVEPGGPPPRMLHVRPQRACCAGSMHVHMQQLLFLLIVLCESCSSLHGGHGTARVSSESSAVPSEHPKGFAHLAVRDPLVPVRHACMHQLMQPWRLDTWLLRR